VGSLVVNLFGFDLGGFDAASFLSLTRVLFAGLALLGAALAARSDGRRAGRIVLGVALAGHALAWFATMFPLPNPYGVNGSMDRENHLGWANVVALGFSPLRTFQVNHLHFEPVWPLLTALASGFEVERVGLVFQWAPLAIGAALILSVWYAWVRGLDERPEAGVEAAFAAMGAVLLISAPDDFSGPFRSPWALTFLLKPNHALGLVLVPLAALTLARAGTWRRRLFAGLVLQMVGWAFVIHMAFFVAGLAVFVALSWITRRADRVKDLVDAGMAVGVNLALVSPYLVMLLVAYPFPGQDQYRLSPFSERPFEGPLRLGALFLLSAVGAWSAYRESGRLGRIMASQWLGAQLVWQLFPVLGLFGQAREQDEAFYWCRFWIGLFAGVGMLRLALLTLGSLQRMADSRVTRSCVGRAVAAALLILLPALLPAWWDPLLMDQYFVAARRPLPAWIAEPTAFIRTSTPRDAVFAGDRNYARWIAAYGARRVLLANSLNAPNDHIHRAEIESALLRDGPKTLISEGRQRYSLQFILATSKPLSQAPDLTLEMLRALPYLETVYDREFPEVRVMIFRLRQESVRP